MKTSDKNSGFSTIEILIAMTILVIALSAIILVTFGDQSVFTDSQTNAEALGKAKEVLENEQALSGYDFKLINPSLPKSDDIYNKSISVENVDFFTKKVTSTVAWISEHNRPEHVDLTALITNFDIPSGGDTCYSNLSSSGDWTKPRVINSGHNIFSQIIVDNSDPNPITDLDVYQGKLYVSVNTGSTFSLGVNNPNAVEDSADVGTVAWANPANVQNSDNSRATATLTNGNATHYLKATNFGFNIPSWATITGIKVEVERSIAGTTGTGVKDNEIKIIKADGNLGVSNKADTSTNWPVAASESYATYNPSDLWGEKWSPADINNSNFGVAISAKATSSRTAQIDEVRITVSYTRQFYVLDISDSANPTFISSLGSNTISTGINAITTDGKHAYLATNSSTGQFQILDLSGSTPSLVSTLKIGTTGTSVGNSIFYKNGYVYLGLTHTASGPNEFNIIDVHNPSSPTLVATASIGNGVNDIYVLNNYAFVASPNANDLLVFDVGVSKLATGMTPLGSFSGTGGLHGKSVYVVGGTAYLGRTFGTNELYALDVSALPVVGDLGHIDAGTGRSTSVNSLIVRDYLSFALNTAGQFAVWRTDTPSNITRYDTTPLTLPASTGNKTPMDCEGDYFYTGSTDASNNGFINIISSS